MGLGVLEKLFVSEQKRASGQLSIEVASPSCLLLITVLLLPFTDTLDILIELGL